MPALRVTSALSIPLEELSWRFARSGGPGGQHANTSDTRAEVRFDVAESPSLGPRQRARLLERLGPVVTARSSDSRSQARNREIALDRLRAEARRRAPRATVGAVPPRPRPAARERRLDVKHRQSARKRDRRPPDRGGDE